LAAVIDSYMTQLSSSTKYTGLCDFFPVDDIVICKRFISTVYYCQATAVCYIGNILHLLCRNNTISDSVIETSQVCNCNVDKTHRTD